MNANEAIKKMLATTGVSQTELAIKLGGSKESTNARVSSMLRSPVKANVLAQVADILGYDLILVRRRSSDRIKVEYDPDFVSLRSKK